MTDIERACEHRCARQSCKYICEYAALYVAGMEAGRKEVANEQFKEAYKRYVNNSLATFDIKKELQNARDTIKIIKENEQLKAENEQIKKNWHDCFLSCSSPYCAAHFPAVEMQGELGNMSKREPEAEK